MLVEDAARSSAPQPRHPLHFVPVDVPSDADRVHADVVVDAQTLSHLHRVACLRRRFPVRQNQNGVRHLGPVAPPWGENSSGQVERSRRVRLEAEIRHIGDGILHLGFPAEIPEVKLGDGEVAEVDQGHSSHAIVYVELRVVQKLVDEVLHPSVVLVIQPVDTP